VCRGLAGDGTGTARRTTRNTRGEGRGGGDVRAAGTEAVDLGAPPPASRLLPHWADPAPWAPDLGEGTPDLSAAACHRRNDEAAASAERGG
jgi:hypothetical protein